MKRVLLAATLLCVANEARATETVDQYLDRMRMRRDSPSFRACTEDLIKRQMAGEENVGFCVPPDYNTEQEAWRSGEWQGTR